MTEIVKKSAADELAETQLAIAKQQLRKAELENQSLEQQISLLEQKDQNRTADAQSRGISLTSSNEAERREHNACVHQKGGSGDTWPRGDGEHGGYSIIRHRLPNNEIYMRCTRCGKEWLPPVLPVATDPKYKVLEGGYKKAMEDYKAAMDAYKTALSWPTDNKLSGGPRWHFKDREVGRAAFRGTNSQE